MIVGLVIDRANFEQGVPTRALYNQILDFLTKNSGKAYNEGEIQREMLNAIGGEAMLKTLTSVGQQAYLLGTLDNLIADGKVTARRPGVFVYYIATQPDTELQSAEDDAEKRKMETSREASDDTNDGDKK